MIHPKPDDYPLIVGLVGMGALVAVIGRLLLDARHFSSAARMALKSKRSDVADRLLRDLRHGQYNALLRKLVSARLLADLHSLAHEA